MDEYIERPSRSEKKREQEALRLLAVDLVELTAGKFAKLELPEDLRRALVEARRLPSPNARRRQVLFVAGLMDQDDAALIRAKLRAVDFTP